MMTLNHGFSGYVCGRVVLPLTAGRAPLSQGLLAAAFFLGAMMPDLDAGMNLLGRSYYWADAWYGHRQASHSILGTLILASWGAAFLTWPAARRAGVNWPRVYLWLVGCFWAGGLIHLVGDYFTPRLAMPILWPWPGRFGGVGHIGWFSPYLFWLFVLAIGFERIARLAAGLAPHPRAWQGTAMWAINALAAGRWVQYLLTSRYESGAQWAAYQGSLLPDAMIAPLTVGVRAAWYWMVR